MACNNKGVVIDICVICLGRSPSAAALQANAAKEGGDEMADGLTMEAVQTEAAARQRAFESQEANDSTSGRGAATGPQMTFHLRLLQSQL